MHDIHCSKYMCVIKYIHMYNNNNVGIVGGKWGPLRAYTQ